MIYSNFVKNTSISTVLNGLQTMMLTAELATSRSNGIQEDPCLSLKRIVIFTNFQGVSVLEVQLYVRIGDWCGLNYDEK